MHHGHGVEVADTLCSRTVVGLDEAHNRARREYGPGDEKRILAMLDQPPPAGYPNWTAPLLARALGDVHEQYIRRFRRAQRCPHCEILLTETTKKNRPKYASLLLTDDFGLVDVGGVREQPLDMADG